ncbi:MAG: GIY-YIG nuclease family protein, partial [Candidatus Korobacteraceae bacterium]
MQERPKLDIICIDGTAEGVRIVSNFNWSGQCVVCSRDAYEKEPNRKEFDASGVYLLIGPPAPDLPLIYVGEGDTVNKRLRAHGKAKSFWQTLVLFTRTPQPLGKTQIQYLESRLCALASAAKKCKLDNGNEPTLPSMPEADKLDAEIF